MAAVSIPALSNHLPEFQGSHPCIQQEYKFLGALDGLEIRRASPGVSAALCWHPELEFLLAGLSAGGLQGRGLVEAVTKQDGQTVVGVFLATAPLRGARRSMLPLAPVSRSSRVPAASRLGDPARERQAQAAQPREDTHCMCF